MTIAARVAAVVSDSEVAINVGAHQGVQADDVVVVMRTFQIADPDTGLPIGEVTRPKLRLRVVEVQPDLAVAKSIEPVAAGIDIFSAFVRARTKGVTSDIAAAGPDVVFVGRGDLVFVEVKAPMDAALVAIDDSDDQDQGEGPDDGDPEEAP